MIGLAETASGYQSYTKVKVTGFEFHFVFVITVSSNNKKSSFIHLLQKNNINLQV